MARQVRRGKGRGRGNSWWSKPGLWAGLAMALLIVCYLGVLELSRPHVGGTKIRYDELVKFIGQGRLEEATILDEDAYTVGTYTLPDGTSARFNAPLAHGTQNEVLERLIKKGVPTTVNQQVSKRVAALATMLLPGLMITVLFIYLIISYKRGTGLFGIRSGARKIEAEDLTVTFADVAGQEAAITELKEIKEFLADPERFAALGAVVPKGILLFGPPGCGKTLMARALAGEAGASFYSISGSDFVELYVGVGAARVRDLFEQARENSPSLIFIDELDSIGRARSSGGAMSHGEQEHALNQVLTEMDGFSTTDGIIVVAATNRPDILDPALLRPGRFDRSVSLDRPDEAGRLAILQLHTKDKPLDPDVDLALIAKGAIGLTGADLAAVMNEGAMLAARAHQSTITHDELDTALTRILEAPERQRRLSMRDRSIGRRSVTEERVTFADVGGVDDALVELSEVAQYLVEPERFTRMGARAPRGVLLYGPPGCGKTLLARAVAGEANAAFLSVAGSEFVEVFAGEGASRVRELFAEARAIAPSIVFIDEIDAVGRRREGGGNSSGERDQTLNQILVEMDGFSGSAAVLVMAATNRRDILDSALLRPGRFDRQIELRLPDQAGRKSILTLHAVSSPLAPDVDLDALSEATGGFSGADLANLVNEAALLAIRGDNEYITTAALDLALERMRLGLTSNGLLLTEEERRVVAFHEAGHAVAGAFLPGTPQAHRISILPRGGALGHVSHREGRERILRTSAELIAEMAVSMAGKAAEELVLGEARSGSAIDISSATALARTMVYELGMSNLAPRSYSSAGPSDELAGKIDAEINRLLAEAMALAADVLRAHRGALDRVAKALLERDTLNASDLAVLVGPVDG